MKDRRYITALARGLEILRAYTGDDQYLGNGELSRRTGIPKPTVSRVTYTLTQLGYLDHDPEREKYRLGPGVLALGYRFLADQGVRSVVRPYLQSLATATDCNVSLGIADGTSMVYIETCHGSGPLLVRLDMGSRLPMATTAIGRAWLSGLDDTGRSRLCERLAQEHGQDWPDIEAGIDAALIDYRERGYCLSTNDWQPGISAIATPLQLAGGADRMAINCGGASLRFSREVLEEEVAPRLLSMKQRLGEALGST